MSINCSQAGTSRYVAARPKGAGFFVGLFSLLGFFILAGCSASLASVPSGRVVRVGVYQNAPKIFLSDNHISGIFGDLINGIADREGWTLVPVPCQWQQCLSMVQSGKIDLMPDVAYSSQRAKYMVFGHVSALYIWSELYRRRNTTLDTIQDLAGKRVAVLDGSIQQTYLEQMINDFDIKNVHLIATPDYTEAFQMTAQGKVFAVAANYFYGDAAALKYHLRSTPVIFDPAQLYFVTPKGHDVVLLTDIDSYLSSWEASPNSPYYSILKRWRVEKRITSIPVGVWWSLGILIALLVFAAAANWLLQRQVAKRSYDLDISERKFGDILNSVDANIYIKDRNFCYQYVNEKVAEFFGLPTSDIIGQSNDVLFDSDTAARLRGDDERVIYEGIAITLDEEFRNKDGEICYFVTTKQPLRDSNGHVYALFGVSQDITERRLNEEKFHRLAFYDPITDLPNRTLLLTRTKNALNTYASTRSDGAILFLDLDNFKILNDTLGHAKGDLLLQQTANRLRQLIRKNDTLARLGGDEFVILMEDLGNNYEEVEKNIMAVGDKLLHALSEKPFFLEDVTYNITASIGISTFSTAAEIQDGLAEDVLLKQADMAMYAAKSVGRNSVKLFNPAMQAALAERADLEKKINEAIKLEQFQLAFQPIVDNKGCVIAAEALVRWTHPEKGEIKPEQFIPCAESTGQIIPIGKLILREACQQLAVWQIEPSYRDLVLAINVSARQFYHPDFVQDVIYAIAEAGVKPQNLELELTESLVADDVETLIEKMNTLKAIGIRFSLDDFGTGYSSLSYLKRLPLDNLKIDQTFVRDLLIDPHDAAIIRTIIALGKALDLNVIAEGVETEEQRDVLLNMGCQRLQGYLFGYPGGPDQLIKIATQAS